MLSPPAAQACLCPSCRTTMLKVRFERKISGEVELDLCFACQGIWFDEHESVQLAPASVIELFRMIHQHRDDARLPLATILPCPRCNEHLIAAQDRVKSGVFNYLRCLEQHGRFIIFAQFMIEKGFVRQLTGAEINQLKATVGVIRCSGCGAPVDIRQDSACSHCRAPIAILDAQAVEAALAGYEQLAQRPAAPTPDMLADTILFNERERSRRQRERGDSGGADLGDLLLDGVAMLWESIEL